MKKTIFALFVPVLALFALFSLPNESLASEDPELEEIILDDARMIWEGRLEKGRILVPLRDVSEQLGADVKWNQQLRTVTINRGDKEISLTINSNKAKVNGKEIIIDAPAKLEKSRTYIPLRFVSQSLGAEIRWSQALIRAIITLDDKQLIVYAPEPITEQQIRAFTKKANEATDLSKYSQIRTHFRPYFTDGQINKLIRQGLDRNEKFPETGAKLAYYNSTEALVTSRLYFDDYLLMRGLFLVKTPGGWKVDRISHEVQNDNIQP